MDAASFLDGASAPAAAPANPNDAATFLDGADQNNSWWRKPAMIASSAIKGALGALGNFGDMPPGTGDPFATPGGVSLTQADQGAYPQGAPVLQGATRRAGITDRPDLVPQDTTERVLAAGGEGAGASLPLAAFGGLSAVPSMIAQGFGGGAGGELAATYFPDHPLIARFFGSLAGGGAGGLAANTTQRAVNVARGVSSPMTEAYDNLGIPTTLAGDVTGNPTLQRVQAFTGQAPVGGRVNAASEDAITHFGRAVDDTASILGPAKTMEDAGTALQTNARGWLDGWKRASKNAWDNVDVYIPGSTPVSMRNYDAALDPAAGAMAAAPETARVLQPGLSRDLFAGLQLDASASGTLPWQAVKAIRSRIGEKLSNPGLVADLDTAELKRVYAALSQDMQGAAAGQGPDAVNAFNTAAQMTKGGHYFIDNAVSKIIGGDKAPVRPGDAVNFALGGAGNDGTRLALLRQGGLDEGVDNLAAWKLRDAAKATAGKQDSAGSKVSPTTFLTDTSPDKISPEASSVLFQHPQVARNLDDLKTVAGRMKDTTEFVNTSKTGPYLTTKSVMEAPVHAAVAAGAGYAAAGLPGALVAGGATLSAPFVPGLLGGLLTGSQPLTRFMASPATPAPRLLGHAASIQGGLLPALLDR